MTIGARLRSVIDDIGINVSEFSRIADIPYGTLQQYLSDKRSPATEALTKICTQTNIDIHWLLTGKGLMYRNETTDKKVINDLKQRHISLLKLFDMLNETQQQEVLAIASEKDRLNKLDSLMAELLKKLG